MSLLYVVFFLTGATALVFQSLWFHQCGLALGNSVWASSAVLSAFMAGLALGNAAAARYGHRVARPVRLYAIAEVTIGAVGAGIVFGLPALGEALAPVFAAVGVDSTVATNSLRFVAAFVLMLAPATMMGFTLPILTRALTASDPSFGRVLGRLYGFNTLGAVLGTIVSSLLLVPMLGVPVTAVIATVLNGLAAVAVLAIEKRAETPTEEKPEGALDRRRAAPFLAAAFAAGFLLLGLEVVWFRILVWFVPNFPSSFALMLAVVLLGIALGGFVGGRFEQQLATPAALFGLPLAAGLLGVAGFEVSLWVRGLFSANLVTGTANIVAVSLPLMLPTCVVSGILFTALGTALRDVCRTSTEATGLLTLSNTLGAAIGPLVTGVLFLPALGLEGSLTLLLVLYAAVAFLLLLLLPAEQRIRSGVAVVAVAVATVALFPRNALERNIFDFEHGEVVAKRYGMAATVAYVENRVLGKPREHWLFTNGVMMATTHHFARRYMELFAFLPAALHPKIETALLISFGTGQTARALTEVPGLQSLDIVDINNDILEMADVVFTTMPHPLRDPRVDVHVEDGRFFLQATDQTFDLITAEPPPPAHAGVFALYSREYFELVKRRLAPGGIVAYWLPVHLTTEEGSLAIVRAFCDVFPSCTLWRGMNTCLTLVAYGEDYEHTDPRRLFDDEVARERLRTIGIERPEHLGALWIGGPEFLTGLTRDVEPVTDDFPHRIPPFDMARKPVIDGWLEDMDGAVERYRTSELARQSLGPIYESSNAYFEAVDSLEDRFFANLESFWKLDRSFEVRDIETLLEGEMRVGAMWAMGSDVQTQQIYDSLASERQQQPDAQLHMGVRKVLDGDYRAAREAFRNAIGDPRQKPRAEILERYAAFKLGEGGAEVLDEKLPGKPR